MKVYWVLGWDEYYPDIDNWLASFKTREEALEYIVTLNQKKGFECYKVLDISGRL